MATSNCDNDPSPFRNNSVVSHFILDERRPLPKGDYSTLREPQSNGTTRFINTNVLIIEWNCPDSDATLVSKVQTLLDTPRKVHLRGASYSLTSTYLALSLFSEQSIKYR